MLDRGSVSGISLDTKRPPRNCQLSALIFLGARFWGLKSLTRHDWDVPMCWVGVRRCFCVSKRVVLSGHLGGVWCWYPVWFQLRQDRPSQNTHTFVSIAIEIGAIDISSSRGDFAYQGACGHGWGGCVSQLPLFCNTRILL